MESEVRTRFALRQYVRHALSFCAIPKDTIGTLVESEDKRRRHLWTAYTPFVITYIRNDERTELAANSSDRKLTSNCTIYWSLFRQFEV